MLYMLSTIYEKFLYVKIPSLSKTVRTTSIRNVGSLYQESGATIKIIAEKKTHLSHVKIFCDMTESKFWPEACNFIKKETLPQVFSFEFCEISKNTFPYRTPPVAASELFQYGIMSSFSISFLNNFLYEYYGVPFVTLHLHMKDKLNIFGASISKWSLYFKIELQFSIGAFI